MERSSPKSPRSKKLSSKRESLVKRAKARKKIQQIKSGKKTKMSPAKTPTRFESREYRKRKEKILNDPRTQMLVADIKEKVERQKEQIKRQKELERMYRPGGEGAQRAKKHFYELAGAQKMTPNSQQEFIKKLTPPSRAKSPSRK